MGPEGSSAHHVQRFDSLREELNAARRRHNEAMRQRRNVERETGLALFQVLTSRRYSSAEPETQMQREQRMAEIEAQRQAAVAKEEEALAKLEEATQADQAAEREFLMSTVESRVEAAKLRHEEHKQRATVSATSIVGISATSALLLPKDPSHVWLLLLSLGCLFFCTGWSLWDMERTSRYVEDTLIREAIALPRGVLAGLLLVARNTLIIGLILFAGFVAWNL